MAKTAFYLIKEVGLSHQEIFGGREYVNLTEEVERDCLLGDKLDYILGKRKIEKTEEVETRGMNIRVFAAYTDLFQQHQERKEKERQKSKTRQNMKAQTFG